MADVTTNSSTNQPIAGTQAAANAAALDPLTIDEKKRLQRALTARDNAKQSPENNVQSIAFLALLFKLFCIDSKEDSPDAEVIEEFQTSLDADEGIFSQISDYEDGSGESPVIRVLQNEQVSSLVRTKYGIENPIEFARSAQSVFKDNKGDAWEGFLDHLMSREGYRNTVYKDSLGKPTVGVGHLITSADGLNVGDRISDAQVMEFLKKDASAAYRAAIEQAKELNIEDKNVVIGLASVNYQLGLGWRTKFPKTWEDMKNGDYERAILKTEASRWNKQTPVRVDDFQQVLARAADIRDKKIEAVALNDTSPASSANPIQVATAEPAKAGLTAEFAAGGKAENAPVASTTAPVTVAAAEKPTLTATYAQTMENRGKAENPRPVGLESAFTYAHSGLGATEVKPATTAEPLAKPVFDIPALLRPPVGGAAV